MPRRPTPPGVDRRQQILEAALDVFAESGFAGATTKDIATKADVTQGLIYFYFNSKENLFHAACEHRSIQLFPEDIVQLLNPEHPPEMAITQLIQRLVTLMDEPCNIKVLRIMTQAQSMCDSQQSEGYKRYALVQSMATPISTALQVYFDEQIHRGTMQPIDTYLAAHLLAGSIVSSIVKRALALGNFANYSHEILAQNITQIFLHGLLS